MTTDQDTSLATLRNEVQSFVDERNWEKFHSPKNISMALAVEAAELMEHFQWISMDESRTPDQEKRVEIGEEIADIFCYVMAISNSLNIDLTETFYRKMKMNREKYPAEEFKGRFGKDDPSPVQS
jgi:NTP pyrophosphatase (non-canonical NTP hydrolase)